MNDWASKNGASLSLLVLPNVYGDGCKPHYNSVVATFCYQLTHGEKPRIFQDREVELIYINELTEYISRTIREDPRGVRSRRVLGTTTISVSELLSILEKFKECYFTKCIIPNLSNSFHANLYRVFLSYLDHEDISHSPLVQRDTRGELFEIIRLSEGGQLFCSITKPGEVRGNHYHTRKLERFCVLKGEAIIRQRKVGSSIVKEYPVSGKSPTTVEMPIFTIHNIENVGHEDLYTMFWCNEILDPKDTDTYFQKV